MGAHISWGNTHQCNNSLGQYAQATSEFWLRYCRNSTCHPPKSDKKDNLTPCTQTQQGCYILLLPHSDWNSKTPIYYPLVIIMSMLSLVSAMCFCLCYLFRYLGACQAPDQYACVGAVYVDHDFRRRLKGRGLHKSPCPGNFGILYHHNNCI